MNGVATWLLFGAPFGAIFYGVGRHNCYVPRQHIPSIIQATVPVMPNLSSLLCLLTSDGGSNARNIRVRARGGGLWRIRSNVATLVLGSRPRQKGLQRCEPKGSSGVKVKALQRCGPRGSRGVTSHTPESVRKCEGV